MNTPSKPAIPIRLIRRVASEVRQTKRRIQQTIHDIGRDPQPFATHLPVLAALPLLRKIEAVTEFGSGPFSTNTFLNRELYTDLRTMFSYDDDQRWFEEVNQLAGTDQRVRMTLTDGPVYREAQVADMSRSDIIFIDDSKTRPLRVQTITSVANRQDVCGWVVIHDQEVGVYRKAARQFRHHFVFDVFRPNVGIHSHRQPLPVKQFKRIRAAMKLMKNKIDIDDVASWHQYFVDKGIRE